MFTLRVLTFSFVYADDQPTLLPAVIEAKLQEILQPLTIPRPVTQPPLNVKPKLNFSTHPSARQLSPELPPSRPLTLASQRNYGSESNLLDSLSSSVADEATVSGDGGSWSRTGMRAAGSVPDLLSPRLLGEHSKEPPPLPPERPVASSEKPNASDLRPDYYDTPAVSDAFYNTPPVKYPHQNDAAEFYNVPATTYPAKNDNSVDGACYDVPPTDEISKVRKKQMKAEECDVTDGAVYNIPPAHNAGDSSISAAIPGGEFYENVPSGGGSKSRKHRDAERSWSADNQKSSLQTTSVCLAGQTYDIPSAVQRGDKPQSQSVMLSASTVDETYDSPVRTEIKDTVRPITNISDQTYDTPPASEPVVKTRPDKPQRGKLRPSLQSEFAGQDTYDVPPPAAHPSSTVKVAAAPRRSLQQSDEMYDVPPPKSDAGRSSDHISLSGAANLTGLSQPGVAEDQTYNVPSSCVPPVPVKRNPPPKPPRPTVTLSTHGVIGTSTSESVKTAHDTSETELMEKDTVPELPSGVVKGLLKYCEFFVSLS